MNRRLTSHQPLRPREPNRRPAGSAVGPTPIAWHPSLGQRAWLRPSLLWLKPIEPSVRPSFLLAVESGLPEPHTKGFLSRPLPALRSALRRANPSSPAL